MQGGTAESILGLARRHIAINISGVILESLPACMSSCYAVGWQGVFESMHGGMGYHSDWGQQFLIAVNSQPAAYASMHASLLLHGCTDGSM